MNDFSLFGAGYAGRAKFGQIWIKFDYVWAKSKSCIPKNIRSPTAMLLTYFFFT